MQSSLRPHILPVQLMTLVVCFDENSQWWQTAVIVKFNPSCLVRLVIACRLSKWKLPAVCNEHHSIRSTPLRNIFFIVRVARHNVMILRSWICHVRGSDPALLKNVCRSHVICSAVFIMSNKYNGTTVFLCHTLGLSTWLCANSVKEELQKRHILVHSLNVSLE